MDKPQMQLEDWLDDLCVRFIINLPQEDLSSVARICFQVEEAQWFYEDFIRPLDPSLPSLTLRTFCLRIFQHCPLLASFSVENHTKAFEEFLQYKTRVPVRGAIMLNHEMDSVVLVKGWKKGANWSFPRGKINKDEDDLACAVREVYEETGLDLEAAGLVPTEAKPKYIEISMREQQLRLYVFRDIPMDTNFQPRTRKEISKIQWYRLSELPTFRKKTVNAPNEASTGNNKFYMVAPFLVPLKKWVISQKKQDEKRNASGYYGKSQQAQLSVDEGMTEDDAWTSGRETIRPHVPRIETLDGATQELQRLLRVQPPTQGLQIPVTREDKGSALLSMLQARDSGPIGSDIPEYQQQAQHHQPNPNNYQQHQHHQQPPQALHHVMNPVHPGDSQGSLFGHGGQPIGQFEGHQPQQFQATETQQFTHANININRPSSSTHNFSGNAYPGPGYMHNQPQIDANRHGALPNNGDNDAGKHMPHLSGQSMALLSAFKRVNLGQAMPPQELPPQVMAKEQQQSNRTPYDQTLPPTGQDHTQNIYHATNNHLSELADSSVKPADGHRSALLGMFKQSDAPSVEEARPKDSSTSTQLQEFHPTGSSHNMSAADISSNISLTHLFDSANITQNRSGQGEMPEGAQLFPSQQSQEQRRPSDKVQLASASIMNASELEYSHATGHHHQTFTTNMQGNEAPKPATKGHQQQQLLSLFGSKPSISPGIAIHEIAQSNAVERPKSRILSLSTPEARTESRNDEFRRGSATPISPADESFLLGYLQSVTSAIKR